MLVEVTHAILVFAHLILFSGAFALVVWCDFSILRDGVNTELLNIVISRVVTLFLLLWVTGLLLVGIETRFDISMILSNAKLVIKLICVMVLTFNGVLLHTVAFKILRRGEPLNRSQSIVLCVVGALSTCNWCLAGFIGSANILTQFPISTLLAGYLSVLMLACLCAYFVSKPVQRRLNWHRARMAIVELGITPELNNDNWPKIFSKPQLSNKSGQ